MTLRLFIVFCVLNAYLAWFMPEGAPVRGMRVVELGYCIAFFASAFWIGLGIVHKGNLGGQSEFEFKEEQPFCDGDPTMLTKVVAFTIGAYITANASLLLIGFGYHYEPAVKLLETINPQYQPLPEIQWIHK